jgi:hypothetical protein
MEFIYYLGPKNRPKIHSIPSKPEEQLTTVGLLTTIALMKTKLLNCTLTLLLALTALLLTRCGTQDATSSGVDPTFNSLYTRVLSKNCVGCHQPAGSATQDSETQIDFTTKALAYSTLTGGNSTGISANINNQCSNVPLVSPSHPENSYLLATLATDYHHDNFYNAGCTPYSPSAHGATIGTAEKNAIVEWIKAGALNN